MSIRIAIAKWLAPELSGDIEIRDGVIKDYEKMLDAAYGQIKTLVNKHSKISPALRLIQSLETPKANATVRKMARIAQEALK